MLGCFQEFDALVLGPRSESLRRGGRKERSSLVRPRSKECGTRSKTSNTSPMSCEGGLVAQTPSHTSDPNFRLFVPFIPELYNHDHHLDMLIPTAIVVSREHPTNAFIAEQQWQRITSPPLRPVLRTLSKGKDRALKVSFGPSLHYQPTHIADPSQRYLSI